MLLTAITAATVAGLLTGPRVAFSRDSTPPSCAAVAGSVAPDRIATDLAAALSTHGGAVRWALDRPIVVWLQERPGEGRDAFRTAAEWRGALMGGIAGWNGAAPGIRIAIGRDSATADVRVVWAVTLPTAPNDPAAGSLASLTAGRTTLTPDDSGRAVGATVWIAANAPGGASYQPRDVRAVVQHEFGHVLGLAHHVDTRSVMAPMVVADTIGDDDRSVLRALYSLPIGQRCR